MFESRQDRRPSDRSETRGQQSAGKRKDERRCFTAENPVRVDRNLGREKCEKQIGAEASAVQMILKCYPRLSNVLMK